MDSLPRNRRSFVILLLMAAADKYDNGTTQVLIAKPNRSQTEASHCRGGFPVLAGHRHGYKVPQTAGVKFGQGGSSQEHRLQKRS